MREAESEYYNITGSGSAVFGIFSSINDAVKAENILKTKFPFVWNGKCWQAGPCWINNFFAMKLIGGFNGNY